MDRVSLGFIIAGLYNSGIGIFSKGFSDNLGAVDPLFSGAGCVGIQLWGLAYIALAQRYSVAPAVALVFCLEKLFYAQHWLFWLSKHSAELPAMIEADPLGIARRFREPEMELGNLIVLLGADFADRAINSPDAAVRARLKHACMQARGRPRSPSRA